MSGNVKFKKRNLKTFFLVRPRVNRISHVGQDMWVYWDPSPAKMATNKQHEKKNKIAF